MTKNTPRAKGPDQVTQNRDSIVDIESRLVAGLSAQEHLVEEIHDLQSSERTIRKIVAAMAVALILSIVATAVALDAAVSVQDTAEALVVANFDRCVTRNAAPKAVRDSLSFAYDTLEDLVDPEDKPDIDRLRNSIIPASITDVDCNEDGVLNAKDYP